MRDPYAILGLARNASEQDIKKAYRKLAKALHPDLNPGDAGVENRFKEVSAAYKIIGDAKSKARFDRGEIDGDGNQRAPHFDYAGGGRGSGFPASGFSTDDIFGEFGNFFDNLRGGGGPRARRAGPRKGADRAYRITVDFLDATGGSTRRINLPNAKVLDVAIPAGIEDGKQIRLRGQGDPGQAGGPPGDALIQVTVAAHAHFRREGDDIHLDLPISLPEALSGAKVQAPTISGAVSLTVPKGANTGTTLRLKGKGIQRAGGGKPGDQYVTLRVMLPETPDPALAELVEDWARDHPYNPRKLAGLE